MTSNNNQFTSRPIPNYFDKDPHLDVEDLSIDQIHILSGAIPEEDVIVVSYRSSPNLSFYTANGRLLDVDHYLPDVYRKLDNNSVYEVMDNLKGINPRTLGNKRSFPKYLREIYEAGDDVLSVGLTKLFGLETSVEAIEQFKGVLNFAGSDLEFKDKLEKYYPSLKDFLFALILNQHSGRSNYVHITHKDNIIITSLNKSSGLAVIIETQDIHGDLLPPDRWNIIRTQNPEELKQMLVFRTDDVKYFFEQDIVENSYTTDRYVLRDLINRIEIDSRLDRTENILQLDLVNRCIQTLMSDENIIAVLSHDREVTIINTRSSVIPQKWPKKIVLPMDTIWMQMDENLSFLFAQNKDHEVLVFDMSSDHLKEVANLGVFNTGFKLTQAGSLILKDFSEEVLRYVSTNVHDIIPEGSSQSIARVFADLSHLFKGESIFTSTQYAVDITEVPQPAEEVIPSVVEVAKYDFETNIEAMLARSDSDYEALLDIQNKISIARQNISAEIANKASDEGITFVGRRLQKTINSIVKPSEMKVQKMIEVLRAESIIEEMRTIDQRIAQMKDPSEYKDILNRVRGFEEELRVMSLATKGEHYPEFKAIQKELNSVFAEQISEDGNALFTFLNGEIEQIEKAIKETFDLRQLESLMSTHPAALELMEMIKQPFILQSFAKGNAVSPAGIQKRLYAAIEHRKKQLIADQEQKKAELHAAKIQLIGMIRESIDHFIKNHSGGFSDLQLNANAAYQQIQRDIGKLENAFGDLRSAIELRRRMERLILEKNRTDLERMVVFEGKYAYVQNDPDLYVDFDYTDLVFPRWKLELIEKGDDGYTATFIRDSDLEVFRPSTTDNLRADRSFEIADDEFESFFQHYDAYKALDNYQLLEALWTIKLQKNEKGEFPQFSSKELETNQPTSVVQRKALRCCLEMERRNERERTRDRNVPQIGLEFIDETPFFQAKLKEFLIKAKLQLMSGSGLLLLTGPPSTGKSAFLKFAAAIMNREYFEHASDKWQTKNSLVTAIKFGEHGPYSVPAGFTKAITTPYCLVNIEEIKEWPEALRKSLNPFFAGSDTFIAPDGTRYKIGENILLCAATNLGSMYRQEDEPFTSDFWSRIEVVEYDYADEEVSREYLKALHSPEKNNLVTMQDLVRDYFRIDKAPKAIDKKAAFIAQQLIEFTLLPKADEEIKRDNLQNYIQEYFLYDINEPSKNYNPEEAVKIALKRLPDIQGYSPKAFFDLYDHFVNGRRLQDYDLSRLQSKNLSRYNQLKALILCIRYMEGCLRKVRGVFYSSAGQTEIEGTNREFIKCVYLLSLMGDLN